MIDNIIVVTDAVFVVPNFDGILRGGGGFKTNINVKIKKKTYARKRQKPKFYCKYFFGVGALSSRAVQQDM